MTSPLGGEQLDVSSGNASDRPLHSVPDVNDTAAETDEDDSPPSLEDQIRRSLRGTYLTDEETADLARRLGRLGKVRVVAVDDESEEPALIVLDEDSNPSVEAILVRQRRVARNAAVLTFRAKLGKDGSTLGAGPVEFEYQLIRWASIPLGVLEHVTKAGRFIGRHRFAFGAASGAILAGVVLRSRRK